MPCYIRTCSWVHTTTQQQACNIARGHRLCLLGCTRVCNTQLIPVCAPLCGCSLHVDTDVLRGEALKRLKGDEHEAAPKKKKQVGQQAGAAGAKLAVAAAAGACLAGQSWRYSSLRELQ